MMQITMISGGALYLGAAPAMADPGHIGLLAGHDHWVAGAAIGAAIFVGLWGALRGDEAEDAADRMNETEPETAA